MPHPYTSNTSRGKKNTQHSKLIGGPRLTIGRKIKCHLYNCFLHSCFNPVLVIRPAATDVIKCRLAASIVQFFNPVKAVPGVSNHLACLEDIA